jgi:hypothetical protein
LQYLAGTTRPDISFAVSKLSRLVSNPGDDHWQALERVMHFLKGTVSYGIHYTEYPRVLEGYCDANWISDAVEMYATSGYVFLLVVEKPILSISMKCDNQTVIVKVNSFKDNMKSSRHVKRRLKSVRILRNSGVIALDYVPTAKNLADQFTKGLSRNVINSALSEMGMRPT